MSTLKCKSSGKLTVRNPSNIKSYLRCTSSGAVPVTPLFTTTTFNHPLVNFDYQKAVNTNFGLFQPDYVQRLLDKVEQVEVINDVQKLNDGVLALAARIQNEVDNKGKDLGAEINYNLDITQHYFNLYIVNYQLGDESSATQVASVLYQLHQNLDAKYAGELNAFY